jgi:vacuolar protein-sorting-associated protein 4
VVRLTPDCSYSGSDISIVVRDALMQPVRKVISATHFKPKGEGKWTPCSPGDPEAVEKSWSDLSADELVEPALGMADFVKSIDQVRPTVSPADIVRHEEWTNESGAEGV